MLALQEYDNSLDNYIKQVQQIPILSEKEELNYYKLKHEGDLNAVKILINSHLRLVIKVAFKYKKYGLPMLDLIQEGNIGLMKAVKEFDYLKGFKLATYSLWWIKASIQEYILKNWSLVKIGTTIHQRKLFFNLSKIKKKILKDEQKRLTNENIEYIAKELNVPKDEVILMDNRLFKRDTSLNKTKENNQNEKEELINFIPSKQPTPENILIQKEIKQKNLDLLQKAIENLKEKEKDILFERYLSEKKVPLKDLSKKYNISGERIRQIEEKSIEKIKLFFLENSNF